MNVYFNLISEVNLTWFYSIAYEVRHLRSLICVESFESVYPAALLESTIRSIYSNELLFNFIYVYINMLCYQQLRRDIKKKHCFYLHEIFNI